MFDSKLPPYGNGTSSGSAYPTGNNPVRGQNKAFIVRSDTESVTCVTIVNPPHALAHFAAMVISQGSSPQSQNPPDINSEITVPQVVRFCCQVEQLSCETLYLLAVHLNLPRDFRLEQLTEQKANNVHPDGSLNSGLYRVLTNKTITHQQLLVALSRSYRQDLVNKYCQLTQITFIPGPNALSCENPYIHRRTDDARRSDDYDRSPTDKSQVLSDSDLCRIFCGQLYANVITPEILAQAAGYPELMNDPLLTKLKQNQLDVYLLLEKILAKKGQMTIGDVQEILYKPEILEIRFANRLDKLISHQPSIMEAQLQSWQIPTDRLHPPQLFGFLSQLDAKEILPDLKSFALALGMPAFRVTQILKFYCGRSILQDLMEVIQKAEHVSVKLTKGHLLYALKESISSDKMADLDSLLQEQPLFQQVVATKLPEADTFSPQKESSLPHRSEPLTMSILSDLPLSHNWFDIGLAMGLTHDELKEIDDKASPKSKAAAFYLSAKLTEPHRKLETGHLFEALCLLNDQDTLEYFPEHLSAKPENTLPEATSRAMAVSRSEILARE